MDRSRTHASGGGRRRRGAALLAIASLAVAAWAKPVSADPQERTSSSSSKSDSSFEVLDERDAEGEQCLVCRQAIHEGGILEVRYKGRTFHVSTSMLDEFEADPDRYFQEMQARSALFDERAMETPPMRTGWLWLGFYVLAGLVFAAATSYAALNRGKPAVGWFFAGLVLNVFALVAVLMSRRESNSLSPGMTKIPSTSTPQACPRCGEANHPSARVCSSCKGQLDASVEPETSRI